MLDQVCFHAEVNEVLSKQDLDFTLEGKIK